MLRSWSTGRTLRRVTLFDCTGISRFIIIIKAVFKNYRILFVTPRPCTFWSHTGMIIIILWPPHHPAVVSALQQIRYFITKILIRNMYSRAGSLTCQRYHVNGSTGDTPITRLNLNESWRMCTVSAQDYWCAGYTELCRIYSITYVRICVIQYTTRLQHNYLSLMRSDWSPTIYGVSASIINIPDGIRPQQVFLMIRVDRQAGQCWRS